MNPWKVILATMVIFGCGVFTGALLTKSEVPIEIPHEITQPPPPPGNPRWESAPFPAMQLQRADFLRKMDKQLSLTSQQKERIGKIMRASQDHTKPLWKTVEPQMREEMKRVRQEIYAELKPDQQKKFEDLLKPRRKGEQPAQPNQPASAQVMTNGEKLQAPSIQAPEKLQ